MWIFGIRTRLGKLYSHLSGQKLEGKMVAIKLEDCADRNLEGVILHGRIHNLPPQSVSTGPTGSTKHGLGSLVLELTHDSRRSATDVQWLLAIPRWDGHGAYRLFIAPIVVNLYKMDAPDLWPTVTYEQTMAIGILKLEKE